MKVRTNTILTFLLLIIVMMVEDYLKINIFIPKWGQIQGALAAHGIALLLMVTFIYLYVKTSNLTKEKLLQTGLLWTAGVFIFELIIFSAAVKRPLADILGNYALWRGELGILTLIEISFIPWIIKITGNRE